MVVSTSFGTKMARRGCLTAISTAHASSGVLYFSTTFNLAGAGVTPIPGFIYATGHTYINFPVRNPGHDMGFVIIYNGPSTISSVTDYAAVSIQLRPSSMGGFAGSSQGSTKEGAFERIYSTAAFAATSTEAQTFLLGPIDTFRYGCNYEGTTSDNTNKYETFIRMMVGHATEAPPGENSTGLGCTHDQISTNAPADGYYILPFQIGTTRR